MQGRGLEASALPGWVGGRHKIRRSLLLERKASLASPEGTAVDIVVSILHTGCRPEKFHRTCKHHPAVHAEYLASAGSGSRDEDPHAEQGLDDRTATSTLLLRLNLQ